MRLETRPQPSAFWSYASPFLALLITVAIGVGLFLALGKDPVKGLQVFFWEPVKSPYAIGELLALAGAGCAVLVVSEELDELFEICDRLYVMAKGQLSPSLPRADATVEKVGLWMSGLWAPAAASGSVA